MAVPPLEALSAGGFEVVLVVTGADKRRGRGSGMSPSPVKSAALDLGLAVSHRVEDVLDVGADLGVVVAFGRLIRQPILERLAMVNVHFSLLPRWRGAAPVERALLAGDQVTGTSLMQLEEGLDTGPVFDEVRVPIPERATADQLRELLVRAGSEQLVRCLNSGLRGPSPQQGEATYASKILPNELCIDWQRGCSDIDRTVRLGSAWTLFRGKRLRVLAARPLAAGQVSAQGAVSLPGHLVGQSVCCGDGGWMHLETVQPEGKAPMPATAWLAGARVAKGELLGS